MNMTKLKELWEKVKTLFKNMSMKMRIILCAVLVLVIVAIAALAIAASNQPYATLFTGLSNAEASAVIDYLQENGFSDYRLEGDTIYVRAGQQDVLTAQLIQAGYPKEGYLYETYFDKIGLTTTNSERNEALKIALEQRLAAIIRNFEGVRDAQVQITLGREQTYVLEDVQSRSSAAVQLTLNNGYVLTDGQAESIRNLISHSVQDLAIEDVEIHDIIGNRYTGDTVTNLNDSSQVKLALKRYYENMIRTDVTNLLAPIYGDGNVQVSVSCTIDINERVRETTEYSQPEGSYENGGLIGKETILGIVSADGVETVGGIPGTTTNSDVDIPTYMEDLLQAAGDGTLAEWYRDHENKINESTEQVRYIGAMVTDIKVAVSINANSTNGTSVEADDLRVHVATGAGIGGEDPESRVSVLIAPFYEVPEDLYPDGTLVITQDLLPYLIIGGAALLVVLIMMIVILRVRRKNKQKKEAEQAAIDSQLGLIGPDGELLSDEGGIPGEGGIPAAPGEVPVTGADIMEINTEKSMELRKSVRQFVQNNPEIAAQMIKAWLKGEGDNG